MDPAAGEFPVDLGAYALGGLDPAAAAAVRGHAAHCGSCRQELDEFAEVRELLDRVPLEALLDGSPVGEYQAAWAPAR
jgi:anti-sigma factor ChrR (cupin superfamily)